MELRRRERWSILLLLFYVTAGCATPIGVRSLDPQDAQLLLTASALSTGDASAWSEQVLQRYKLFERFEENEEATLLELHKRLKPKADPDDIFALAELSFLYAGDSGRIEYYRASTVYAYAFLFPEDGTEPPHPLDPRRRFAADLYNRSITRALALSRESSDEEGKMKELTLEARKLALPFGQIDLTFETSGFLWGGYVFYRFIPVSEYDVRGLRNRYRQAGIGAPLAAELAPTGSGPAAELARKRIPPGMKVPVTLFVRFENPRQGILSGKLHGRAEVYAADKDFSVSINGHDTPLELEPTATLAYQLEGAAVWDFEIAGFRFADQQRVFGDGLMMMHPYRPGRIPVVLVHGTASSPARWAELINELTHNPQYKGHYQFWLYMYNTGQPVLYSAMLLRRALHSIVNELDPNGKDPALRRIVIIGHSQGGLLTKLMAVHSGNRFWENATSVPFDEVEMAAETRDLLREAMFFEPVPQVERVIFIATPHRGSYQATGWVLKVVRWFVRLPGRLVSQFQGLLKDPAFAQLNTSQLPTSVDNMSPGHPFLQGLNDLPIDSRVEAHSIIAVRGEGPLTGKTDGVVAYASAHIDGVESEKVVRSGHSTQGHPETIQEVERILTEHLEASRK